MQNENGNYYLHRHIIDEKLKVEPSLVKCITETKCFVSKSHVYNKVDNNLMNIQFFTNSPLMMANIESAFKLSWKAPIHKNKLINVVQNGMNEQVKSDKNDENIIARINYIQGSNVLSELQKARENAAKCYEQI